MRACRHQLEAVRPSHFFPRLLPKGGRFNSNDGVAPNVNPALELNEVPPNAPVEAVEANPVNEFTVDKCKRYIVMNIPLPALKGFVLLAPNALNPPDVVVMVFPNREPPPTGFVAPNKPVDPVSYK